MLCEGSAFLRVGFELPKWKKIWGRKFHQILWLTLTPHIIIIKKLCFVSNPSPLHPSGKQRLKILTNHPDRDFRFFFCRRRYLVLLASLFHSWHSVLMKYPFKQGIFQLETFWISFKIAGSRYSCYHTQKKGTKSREKLKFEDDFFSFVFPLHNPSSSPTASRGSEKQESFRKQCLF